MAFRNVPCTREDQTFAGAPRRHGDPGLDERPAFLAGGRGTGGEATGRAAKLPPPPLGPAHLQTPPLSEPRGRGGSRDHLPLENERRFRRFLNAARRWGPAAEVLIRVASVTRSAVDPLTPSIWTPPRPTAFPARGRGDQIPFYTGRTGDVLGGGGNVDDLKQEVTRRGSGFTSIKTKESLRRHLRLNGV